jgi:hypothetical protein
MLCATFSNITSCSGRTGFSLGDLAIRNGCSYSSYADGSNSTQRELWLERLRKNAGSGAKAPLIRLILSAQLKLCPFTKPCWGVLYQAVPRLKPWLTLKASFSAVSGIWRRNRRSFDCGRLRLAQNTRQSPLRMTAYFWCELARDDSLFLMRTFRDRTHAYIQFDDRP